VRQYYFRYDGSTSKKYSLAPQSETLAGLIENEVNVMFFGAEGSRESGKVADLLEAYRYLNKNIVYEMYDLDRVPLKAREYDVTEYNTFVVRSGDKIFSERGSKEETITNLLIRATRKRVMNVRFLQGHGEHSTDHADRNGYGQILKKLESVGYTVRPLVLKEENAVPQDTDLLIIASPETDLSGSEYYMLDQYRARGGKFLILVDGPEQLQPLLDSFSLQIGQYPTYDSQNVAGTDPSTPLATKYSDELITKDFSLGTVYPGVHEVKHSQRDHDYEFQPFVRSSRGSWYETNRNNKMDEDSQEEAGRTTIAGVLSHKRQLMKAVVFGDSDFVSNAYVSAAGNANLFVNVVNWLLGEGALTKVAPTKNEFIPMFITGEQARIIRVIVPVGIPLVVFIAGTLVWFRRRRL
jgi:hypothetical protein